MFQLGGINSNCVSIESEIYNVIQSAIWAYQIKSTEIVSQSRLVSEQFNKSLENKFQTISWPKKLLFCAGTMIKLFKIYFIDDVWHIFFLYFFYIFYIVQLHRRQDCILQPRILN